MLTTIVLMYCLGMNEEDKTCEVSGRTTIPTAEQCLQAAELIKEEADTDGYTSNKILCVKMTVLGGHND